MQSTSWCCEKHHFSSWWVPIPSNQSHDLWNWYNTSLLPKIGKSLVHRDQSGLYGEYSRPVEQAGMMDVWSASPVDMQHMPRWLWRLIWYQRLGPWAAVWFLKIQYAQGVDGIRTVNQQISSTDAGWKMIWWAQRLWQEPHGQTDSSWCEAHMGGQSVLQLLQCHDHPKCAWHDHLPRNLH